MRQTLPSYLSSSSRSSSLLREKAHLSIGEVEELVLALVTDVIVLEVEEEGEPVEEVHVGVPSGREAEVTDGA
ncbi:hypothetical protein Ahy_A07g032031 isoform D [Arachis hypogaea]|uniref:Uncharacterized protein n=1 Tax=Arachis hypogaea TaxID=3818 RepID=A0A445C5R6_ARAHY|nr:hypothetical protein Ahy_A07g032031 isoform D [Arachis hypogaea]